MITLDEKKFYKLMGQDLIRLYDNYERKMNMLTDLQRLDYAEAMKDMDENDRTAYLAEKVVTETTDIDVINQLIVDFAEQANSAEEVACETPTEA